SRPLGRQNGCSKCARIVTKHERRSLGDKPRNKYVQTLRLSANFLSLADLRVTFAVCYDRNSFAKSAHPVGTRLQSRWRSDGRGWYGAADIVIAPHASMIRRAIGSPGTRAR